MIIDARTIDQDDELETDVCIVGAGLAGITLAREFIGSDFRVALLESGGFEPDEATVSLSQGESVGQPYDRLDGARYRGFGGNSRTWHVDLGDSDTGVRLCPLDAIDFEARDWLPHSGWPFDLRHLEPYYARAHEVFKIGPYAYDPATWSDPRTTPILPLPSGRVESTMFQFGRGDVFFDEYRTEVLRSSNVTAYLYANVLGLDTGGGGQRVDRVRIGCLPGGTFVFLPAGGALHRTRVAPLPKSEFSVKARIVILAAGGTENPRLLLLSDAVHQHGIGNQHDLVGRFFMEHAHLWSGKIVPSDPQLLDEVDLYRIHTAAGVPVMAKLTLTDETLRRERLPNYCVSIHPHTFAPKGVESAGRLASGIRRRTVPRDVGQHLLNVVTGVTDVSRKVQQKLTTRITRGPRKRVDDRNAVRGFRLNHMSEQVPNPGSRVTLADDRDALGLPRVRLDWRLSPLDIRTIIRAQEIIDEELRRANLGYLQIDLDDDTPPRSIHGGWHHMGTTRMHRDPRQGVVDEHSKVHDVANLYVTGSSVFPTVGYANPSLTICALALRLADRIKEEMASGSVTIEEKMDLVT